ncbi:MAG: cation diffusion facilitator family transporter [Clostridia bacterium]
MDRFKDAKKVGIIGIVGNIFLLTIKLAIALVTKSQGMIADSLNSALDIFSSAMTYIGTKVSEKPKDESHPYGHEKAEYIFSFIISIVMILSAMTIIKSSVENIITKQVFTFSPWLYVVCIVTIATKFCLFLYTKTIGKKGKNILIMTNAEDHRNDMLLTTGTFIGVVASKMGLYYVDGIIGVAISAWICYVGVKIMLDSIKVLMDENLGKIELETLTKIAEDNEYVLHVDSIVAKPIGVKYIIVLKVSMHGETTLNESHKQSGIIKAAFKKANADIEDVIIHINPHDSTEKKKSKKQI